MAAKDMEKQLATQPTEVKYCTKCVVSNQRPRIQFDDDGVCSACRFGEYQKTVDWHARMRELGELCDKHRSKDGLYDVVVPTSGGKDSGFVATYLRDECGMHPLCATFSPFIRTAIGQSNFDRFIQAGFPVIEGHPDGRLHRKLTRLYFEEHGDAWGPFALGQMIWPHQLAAMYEIPLVFYGENGEAAYSGDPKVWAMSGMPSNLWAEQYWKGATLTDMLARFADEKPYLSREDLNAASLDAYEMPPNGWTGVEMHWLSYYHPWVPEENYYWSQDRSGFQANPERSEGTWTKYASLDDKLDGFHYYLAFIKFGIGRATSDAAHEVRDGHIDRDEAISLVRRYDGEFPKRYFRDFLDYLGIDAADFWETVDRWRPPHLWEKQGKRWALKHQIGSMKTRLDGPWNFYEQGIKS